MSSDAILFKTNLSSNAKKQVHFETQWQFITLGELLAEEQESNVPGAIPQHTNNGLYSFLPGGENLYHFHSPYNSMEKIYTLSAGGKGRLENTIMARPPALLTAVSVILGLTPSIPPDAPLPIS